MKYAIVSVSKEGAQLGVRVKAGISGEGTLYERKDGASGKEAVYFTRTLALTADIFSCYDGILFIMASGIAVRAIAPHVVSKASDPAVLVMDECGKHCVSLLSGHLGGANAWAREVSAAVGADPVITTATDVHDRRAPDDIARELMMRVEPLAALKPVNTVIAAGRTFRWFLDESVEGSASIATRLKEKGIRTEPLDRLDANAFDACAVITEKTITVKKPFVCLRPKNLFVGIGCKRGTSEELVQSAFTAALAQAGAYPYQVASLASVDAKADEKGLLDFASSMHLPIHFYKAEELKKIAEEYHLESSKFVEKTIGVGNVCQSAALMESMKGKRFCRKRSLSVPRCDRPGTIRVIGIGPGHEEEMTPKAIKAMEASDIIVGYNTYIALVKDLIKDKEVVGNGMRQEVDRCQKAVDLAAEGHQVAVISSGDPGVYGMAGLVLELIQKLPKEARPECEVIPGLTAANTSAAALGAPLMHDYAVISLSDLMTPWEQIKNRAKLAAEGDFVIAIYNPKSRGRATYLDEIRDIVLQYRKPETPVGIVRKAGRPGMNWTISTLEKLPEEHVDMQSTVIIGKSTTFVADGKMITPRGYKA